MMRFFILVACCFAVLSTTAQSSIKGRVINVETGVPVPGASVFISNTSRGTTSASDGSFEINQIPDGQHQLVISSIGYQTNVFEFNSTQLPLRVKVELVPKIDELENVIVEPFVEETWEKWGRLFTENFIGRSANASYCKILNTKDIRFRYYKKTNRLEAITDKPLIIENRALGYRITYQLEQFEIKFSEKSSFFAGYTLFENLGKSDKNRWVRNREKAYYGSLKHFMQALYSNNLIEEGFEVRRLRKIPNKEKERVKVLWRKAMIPSNVSGNNLVITTPGKPNIDTVNLTASHHPDSLAYYRLVMRQQDYTEEYGKDILTADSLLLPTDPPYKALWFANFLAVTYKKAMEEKEYLDFYGENRKPWYQRSTIFLADTREPVFFDRRGNYWPVQHVFTTAWWGFTERISNMLPVEYAPEK